MSRRAILIILAVLTGLIVPVSARAGDFGFKGWGPRVGLSSNPDQIVGGVQFDLGEFAKNVRFQPSAEIGFGDEVTTLAGNFMVSYYFPVEAKVTPYAGGEVSVVYYDFDKCDGSPHSACGGSDTEIGPAAVGGIEMKFSGKTRFLAELQIGFADLPDFKVVAGWIF